MKNLFFLIAVSITLLTACDMRKAILGTSTKMDTMSGKLDKSNRALHLKILQDAKNEMLAPENTVVPDNPAKMIPAGAILAEEATAEEIVKIVEAYMADVNETRPTDSMKVDGKFPDALLESMEHGKKSKLTALQVVTGFASQQKIQEIVQAQIMGRGRYEKAALQALMFRAIFIFGYRYNSALHERGIINLNELQEAVELTEYVQYIASLPFVDRIGVKARMIFPKNNVNVKMTQEMADGMWTSLNMDAEDLATTMAQSTASQRTHYDRLKQRIERGMPRP